MKIVRNVVADALFAPAGDLAVGMAAAQPKREPKVRINPLVAHFPPEAVAFRVNVKDGKPWTDGTLTLTIADAMIKVGASDVFIAGARIVKLTKANGQGSRLILQLPSSGQAFRHPMLEGDGEEAKADIEAWKKLVVDRFVAIRTEAVKSGAATIKGGQLTQGIAVDDAALAALGVQ